MTAARWAGDIDYPCGAYFDQYVPRLFDMIDTAWGQGKTLQYFGRAVAEDPRVKEIMGRWERLSVSPSGARALVELDAAIDVRPILSAIAVPTLVINRTDDHALPVACGRYLAEHIPGARYFEQPGEHLLGLGDYDALAEEIEEFLTGVRPAAEADRVLATVLFTDLVGSTERAAELGDRAWRGLLDSHHAAVRAQLGRFQGREVKTTGDGFLATFDGPARAIRCACAIREGVRRLGVELRAGLHTGEVEIIGEDVGGIAVHIGQRVSAAAGDGEVWVSRTVKDLVAGSGIAFSDRGTHRLKGLQDEWQLFAVESAAV